MDGKKGNIKSTKTRDLSTLKGLLSFLLLFLLFRLTFGSLVDGMVVDGLRSFATRSSSGIELSSVANTSNSGNLSSTLLYLPDEEEIVGNYGIKTLDPKILAMRIFLIDHNSPLYPYADDFVNNAKMHDLDWRLVASISGVESAFGSIIPYRTNNAWGWRGGPNGSYSQFTSWGHGISVVTERLAEGYGTDLTPFEIEPAYCPPCYANPAHAWANGVTRYMNELEYYLENLENL